MALRRKNARTRKRELLVVKALLLGYTFERIDGEYYVYLPSGAPLTEFHHSAGTSFGPYVVRFPARHVAAVAALIDAGVMHAPEPSGDH